MGDLTMCRPASGSAGAAGAASGQVGNARNGRRSVGKFQPDLDIAAFEVEFGNLVFLEELNQFLKILDVLWFHSFLLLAHNCASSGQSSIRALGAGVST
jgi:hypothetical protein